MWTVLTQKRLTRTGLAFFYICLAHAGIGVPFAHQVFRLRSITAPAKYFPSRKVLHAAYAGRGGGKKQ